MAGNFVERLKLAMEKRGIKEMLDLARRAGVSQNSLTNWITHGRTPRGSSILALANALDVPFHWLARGEGSIEEEMIPAPPKVWKFPATPLMGVPFISNAWCELEAIIENRGLKLTDKEKSQILIKACYDAIHEDREPTRKDILEAISLVLSLE